MATASTKDQPLTERLEPYIAIIGPMVMILAILVFMGIAEPARYFRTTNLNLIQYNIGRVNHICRGRGKRRVKIDAKVQRTN